MEPLFFATPADLRAWFERHHAATKEMHLGFYKKGSGKPSVTWPEAVDEALCVGWIDGVRRSLEPESYVIRFTPRKPGSIWSAVNLRRVEFLSGADRMQPAGLAAFEKRTDTRSKIYAYEQKEAAELPATFAQKFQANAPAWEWFQRQAAWYRRTVIWQIVSAKQEMTRLKRLEKLIACSARGERI